MKIVLKIIKKLIKTIIKFFIKKNENVNVNTFNQLMIDIKNIINFINTFLNDNSTEVNMIK